MNILAHLQSAGGAGILYLDDVRKMLIEMGNEAGSQKAVALELKISPAYLNDVIFNRREPGQKILNALGLEAVTIYVKKQPLRAAKKAGQ